MLITFLACKGTKNREQNKKNSFFFMPLSQVFDYFSIFASYQSLLQGR